MVETSRFHYGLPPERIAQEPVDPRHSSRLLDARSMGDHTFLELPDLLEPGDLVVVNRTRVRAARLTGRKRETGGAVEVLLLRRLPDDTWEALVRPARRLRAGTALVLGEIDAALVTDPEDGVAILDLRAGGDIEDAIERTGSVPLPPYLGSARVPMARYQTVFADRPGSAAAPTAGLHFTDEVLEALDARGIAVASVDLEIGLGTFRPITAEDVSDHVMHRERCRVDGRAAEAIAACRRRGGRVVAAGTTVVRALETFGRPDGTVEIGDADTDLYLTPGSRFQVVDLLVTNFHLPRSSLLVLVEAFMGPGWREAYDAALERGYRFLSFGDAMLCGRRA
jgi:S-adenosylmethionine:tRNA ribosyltransferase-isomerase